MCYFGNYFIPDILIYSQTNSCKNVSSASCDPLLRAALAIARLSVTVEEGIEAGNKGKGKGLCLKSEVKDIEGLKPGEVNLRLKIQILQRELEMKELKIINLETKLRNTLRINTASQVNIDDNITRLSEYHILITLCLDPKSLETLLG